MNDKEKDDFRKEIIKMVEKIQNAKVLKLIYGFVRSGYKEEIAGM